LARALTIVEAGGGPFSEIAPAVFSARRGCLTVGLTGAPGAGKSSLTGALVTEVRGVGRPVAVIAVDPSSPFSGGAILGDRVRLSAAHAADDGVFMRSLASRGQLGGLSLAVPGMIALLDAAGWPVVFIETVGVGQSEVAIAERADTTIVVLNPGWGDEVQANKAGLLEVADVLVVNKCDRGGADATVRDLEHMLHLGSAREWMPPIVRTVATAPTGVDELWTAIGAHRAHLESTGELERRRAARRLADVRERVRHDVALALCIAERTDDGTAVLDAVAADSIDPVSAASRLVAMMGDQLRERR
jgi:LAO/AO transport system kinase